MCQDVKNLMCSPDNSRAQRWLLFNHPVVSNFLQPWAIQHATLSSPSLSPGFCSNSCPFELVMPSNHLILCCLLLLLPSVFPCRAFSNELTHHIRWLKYWSFSISLSNEYSGLISFRNVWFGLLADQGTFKRVLQPHSSKASVLLHSVFFMVQLSHPYMTTGKAIALTTQTFVCKVMSLLFNTLSGLS